MSEWDKAIHVNEFKNNNQIVTKVNNVEVLFIKSNDEYFAVTSKPSSWYGFEGRQSRCHRESNNMSMA